MIKAVRAKKNILEIITNNDQYSYSFDGDIQQTLMHNNAVYVLVSSAKSNTNVYCLNAKGHLVWQVQDPDLIGPNKSKTQSPFTWIQITTDSKLEGFSWDSYRYEIDLLDGTLKNPVWTK